MAKKNNSVMSGGAIVLMAVLVYLFTSKKFLIALGIVAVIIVVAVILKKRKNKPVSLFSQNKITDDAKDYVQKILAFEKPFERIATDEQDGTMIVSENEASDLFGKVLSNKESYNQYETLVDSFYQKAMQEKEDFSKNGEEELANQITYSVWGICESLKKIIIEKDVNTKSFYTISELVSRLVYVDEELFKPFFYALQGFCFWYIYEKDFLYSIRLRHIKRILLRNNGIKQTDFYRLVGYPKDDVSFTLYYAELANEIRREKSGRSYQLYLLDTEKNQN